jgi:hypothetical protein
MQCSMCSTCCPTHIKLAFSSSWTVNEIICHDMLKLWLMPRLLEDNGNVFQHDGVAPYIHQQITFFNSSYLSDGSVNRVHFLASWVSRNDIPHLLSVAFCERWVLCSADA